MNVVTAGFLEDMQSLEPSRRQESGRKAYRDGLAHLQKANRLQQICRYKLDPVELNQVGSHLGRQNQLVSGF